jgi:uncharacterized protein YndB with AHSA1/START domain
MARIVFELEINASPKEIAAALDTQRGIAGWWTEDVVFPGGVGSQLIVGFPGRAPVPFDLRVDEADEHRVRWASVGQFPPHWVDTEIIWTLTPKRDGSGTTVHFNHDGWATDEGALPMSAMTWGQLMGSLKTFVETGTGAPLYRHASDQ